MTNWIFLVADMTREFPHFLIRHFLRDGLVFVAFQSYSKLYSKKTIDNSFAALIPWSLKSLSIGVEQIDVALLGILLHWIPVVVCLSELRENLLQHLIAPILTKMNFIGLKDLPAFSNSWKSSLVAAVIALLGSVRASFPEGAWSNSSLSSLIRLKHCISELA